MFSRAHRTLVAAICLAACGGGGGGDVATGVLPPPTPLSDAQAAEAASGAAVSLIAAFSAVVLDAPELAGISADPLRGRAALFARHAVLATNEGAPAQPAAPCPGGGTIRATCAERGGVTTLATRSSDCVLVDDSRGVSLVVSGELEVSIQALGVCQSGEVPPAAPRTLRYRHFRATVQNGPTVIESFAAPLLTQRIEPSGAGCADVGHMALDGRLVVARTNAVDVTLDAHGLELELSAGGEPCLQQIEATGRLDVSDHASGRRFAAALRGLRVSFEAGSAVLVATLDGATTLDCIGEIAYATEESLSISGPCASRGAIRITLPSGATAQARSGAAGVELDYDGDGSTDRLVVSCLDPSVASCS